MQSAIWILVFILVYTAASKLVDLHGFIKDMHNQPFPGWLSAVLVVLVPAMEFIAAILLLSTRWKRAGLILAMVLMSAFTIYTLSVLLHAFKRIPCSCGGIIKELSWKQHFALNVFLTTISIIAYKLHKRIHA